VEFLVGASKVDITPNYGSPTRRWHLGDERARIQDIASPLHARTIALSDGKRTTTITSLEVACLYKPHFDAIRELARATLPVPVQDIILHNTHQHSDSFIEYEPSYDAFGLNDVAFDMDYVRSIPGKVVTSIALALKRLSPAVVGYGSGAIAEGIASCRRVETESGDLVWRGSRPAEHLRALPRGHIDPEAGVLTFVNHRGSTLATLFNYACHPSAAGGDSPNICSADFSGYAAQIVEQQTGGISLFLHGCSGDINPGKYVRGTSLGPKHRIADAKRMGQILAGEVLKVLGLVELEPVRHFQSVQEDCWLPVQPSAGDSDLCLQEAMRATEDWRQSGSDPRKAIRKYVVSHRIVDARCPVTIGAAGINETALAFVPGEPFTRYGEAIKKSTDAKTTLVAATCGEEPFYIPTRDAIAVGGYETSYIASQDTGEALVSEARRLLGAVVADS
jgi:hypothetical protein